MTFFLSQSRHFLVIVTLVSIALLPSCARQKTIKTMDENERKEAKKRFLSENNSFAAIKTLELMLKDATDLNERRDVMLELADLLFENKEYDKAATLYKEFAKYYAGSEKIEYAMYQAIVCVFKKISDAERDQSKTIEVIELSQKFLGRSAVFGKHADEVHHVLSVCNERLFASEMSIVSFYIGRGRYVPAARRLEKARKEYAPVIEYAERDILMSECSLAAKMNTPELLLAKQTELVAKFPESEQFVLAQNAVRSSKPWF